MLLSMSALRVNVTALPLQIMLELLLSYHVCFIFSSSCCSDCWYAVSLLLLLLLVLLLLLSVPCSREQDDKHGNYRDHGYGCEQSTEEVNAVRDLFRVQT